MFGILRKIAAVLNPKGEERRINAEELEDLLIEADLGGTLSKKVTDALMAKAKEEKVSGDADMRSLLMSVLGESIPEFSRHDDGGPVLYLVLGINGSGKTTTSAKLAKHFKDKGKKVVLAAADTFRAAAGEQLSQHAQRLGVRIVRNDNAGGPAAVIYDAVESFVSQKDDVLIADTAGRMHTKENLLKEIQKIDRIVLGKVKKENYMKFLVLDATTGQNAIAQAENFDKAIGVDALILTKVDSGSKGGTLVRICDTLHLPVAFVCNGEKYEDIEAFDKEKFLSGIIGE